MLHGLLLDKFIDIYSTAIREKDLKEVLFRDDSPNFGRRDKFGALYVDHEGILHHSITFKFVTLKDGSQEINFINFRSSEEDLKSIKIPSNMPLKSVDVPFTMLPDIDSTIKANPVNFGKYKTYSQLIASEKHLTKHYQDTLKKVLSFNMQHPLMKNRFEEVLTAIDNELDLSQYTIARYNVYPTPTFHITHPGEKFNLSEVEKISRIFKDKFGQKVQINLDEANKNSFGKVEPMVHLGGIHAPAKVRY